MQRLELIIKNANNITKIAKAKKFAEDASCEFKPQLIIPLCIGYQNHKNIRNGKQPNNIQNEFDAVIDYLSQSTTPYFICLFINNFDPETVTWWIDQNISTLEALNKEQKLFMFQGYVISDHIYAHPKINICDWMEKNKKNWNDTLQLYQSFLKEPGNANAINEILEKDVKIFLDRKRDSDQNIQNNFPVNYQISDKDYFKKIIEHETLFNICNMYPNAIIFSNQSQPQNLLLCSEEHLFGLMKHFMYNKRNSAAMNRAANSLAHIRYEIKKVTPVASPATPTRINENQDFLQQNLFETIAHLSQIGWSAEKIGAFYAGYVKAITNDNIQRNNLRSTNSSNMYSSNLSFFNNAQALSSTDELSSSFKPQTPSINITPS